MCRRLLGSSIKAVLFYPCFKVIYTQIKIMIVPPLEWEHLDLTASVISLALQLNCEIVVEILSHILKSEVPVTLYLDCVAVGMACAFSDDTSVQNFQKLTHENDHFLGSGKNKVQMLLEHSRLVSKYYALEEKATKVS